MKSCVRLKIYLKYYISGLYPYELNLYSPKPNDSLEQEDEFDVAANDLRYNFHHKLQSLKQ
jgi:hypothetical protein